MKILKRLKYPEEIWSKFLSWWHIILCNHLETKISQQNKTKQTKMQTQTFLKGEVSHYLKTLLNAERTNFRFLDLYHLTYIPLRN